jgi:hypothetical protein
VQPPFPAPPVEGKGKRIGLSFGIGAGVLVLVCGGGAAAAIGLGISMTGALNEQAHKAVSSYLDALHAQSYDRAYAMLCQQAKDVESPAQWRDRITELPPIASYQLGKLNVTRFAVPVDATYESGDTAELEAYLGQNQNTGALEVCDLEG